MNVKVLISIILSCVFLLAAVSYSQTATNLPALNELSRRFDQENAEMRGPAFKRLSARTDGPMGALNRDPDIELMGVDENGRAYYYITHNINSAHTISASQVWPGGAGGYDIAGEGIDFGELAVWDAGNVRYSHQEFDNRIFNLNNADIHWHSTHVAGTMIAAGLVNSAKGMSYQADYMFAYDWDEDNEEMADAAATGLKISNHSYGLSTGWRYEWAESSWYWYGDTDVSENEDYQFGFYSNQSQDWDEIAYYAPYYTICKSAGNDRGEGPGPGTLHYIQDDEGEWVQSTTTREVDGGQNGYDCISYYGNAKNIIAVGAVHDIPGGYNGPQSVVMSSFSGWGPADDGRVKPDLVANGIDLYSCSSSSDNGYEYMSGTSMSSPSLAGALNLLVQFYKDTHNETSPLSATMKGLLIHTADESGSNPGPDYKYGWGLMNTRSAVDLIDLDMTVEYTIQEIAISQGEVINLDYYSDGNDPATITIAWTDPPGTPVNAELDPEDLMLVNDLDLRLERIGNGAVYSPYVLNPDNPGAAATEGDNFRDNAEKIYVANPDEDDYIIEISHKGVLFDAPQAFSLIITGLTWTGDDRVPPTNLQAQTDYSNGQVELTWEHEQDLDEFQEFKVYRDDVVIGTTVETNHTDNLPGFGSYRYYVTALYDIGESTSSPQVDVDYIEPLAPVSLSVDYHEGTLGDLTLNWDHVTDLTAAYDDGFSEKMFSFSAGMPVGSMIAQRFTSDISGILITAGAYFSESDDAPFGQARFVVLEAGEDESSPGDTLFVSAVFVPQQEGWTWMDIDTEQATVNEGEDYWVAVSCAEVEHNNVGIDTSGTYMERGYYTTNGIVWSPLPIFIRGNPLIRSGIGEVQVPGEKGLIDYEVIRNGQTVGQTEERFVDDSLPEAGTYTYNVIARYEQGTAESEPVVFVWDGTGVRETVMPVEFAIGQPYPNPFNPEVTVPVCLANPAEVGMVIYDLLGREVARIETVYLSAGNHLVSWNGEEVAAGVYFIRINAGPITEVKKVMMLK